jgi:4-amino-4-deoxy-L-arabinose transferase-like glycosyltransferase
MIKAVLLCFGALQFSMQETDTNYTTSSTSMRTRHFVSMVIVALALRLCLAAFLYSDRLDPARDHWRFAGEAGRIARSLALGQGFSNPLFGQTGATAWLAPGFPVLLAGIFKAFGVYSKASLLAVLSLDCLFSALTCIPIVLIARKLFGERAALWSGWIWVFFPYSIFFAADFVWATTLTTLLMAVAFLMALKLENSGRAALWAGYGAFGALTALVDPVALSVLPVLGLWSCWRRWRNGFPWFRNAVLAGVAFLAVAMPWLVRNYATFGKFIPFRGNLAFEFYCGNNADNWHWDPPGYHPSDTDREWRQYQQLGEMGYVAQKKTEAWAYISGHPGQYVRDTLRRVVYVWTGFWSFDPRYLKQEPFDAPNIVFATILTGLTLIGLWRAFQEGSTAAAAFALALIFFPLVYYFTHPEDYYRRPLDPIMVVLTAYALTSLKKKEPQPEPELEEEVTESYAERTLVA